MDQKSGTKLSRVFVCFLLFVFLSLHTTLYPFLQFIYFIACFTLKQTKQNKTFIAYCGLKLTERRKMAIINRSFNTCPQSPFRERYFSPVSQPFPEKVIGLACVSCPLLTQSTMSKSLSALYCCKALMVTLRVNLSISSRKGMGGFLKRSGNLLDKQINAVTYNNACAKVSPDFLHQLFCTKYQSICISMYLYLYLCLYLYLYMYLTNFLRFDQCPLVVVVMAMGTYN